MRRPSVFRAPLPAALALALLVPGACKGSDDPPPAFVDVGAGGGGGTSSAGAGGDAGAASKAGAGISLGGSMGEECARESKKADPVPLDLFVMLDQSISMLRETKPGTNKWDAVTAALEGFYADAKSSGIGVGIQYFGQVDPAVPATCQADGDCAGKGPCGLQKACNGTQTFVLCETPADCGGKPCEALGTCSANQQVPCFPSDGPKCGLLGSQDLGECKILPGYCIGRDSCGVAGYRTPAVEIATLPGSRPALSSSMKAHAPVSGTTPTGPALQGALEHATAWAAAHPDHIVAVVLATDGLPTGPCTPGKIADIGALATKARAQKPSVGTYVIGVFAADEIGVAQPNLDLIAKAGSERGAFLVTADATAQSKFLAAMTSIRTTALSCDFSIPMLDTVVLDYALVNVRLAGKEILNVPGADKCAEAKGGWYYDVDPATGQAPTKVTLCPTDCAIFKETGALVDVVIGCTTKLAPLK